MKNKKNNGWRSNPKKLLKVWMMKESWDIEWLMSDEWWWSRLPNSSEN